MGNGALIPLEVCSVLAGQIMKKQIPAHKTNDVLLFASKTPQDRLDSIKKGLGVLKYGQSEYVRVRDRISANKKSSLTRSLAIHVECERRNRSSEHICS